MAADTRVSITVDTGNAEGSLNRLRSVFQSLDAATNTASRNLDNAGRASQNAGTRAAGAATAITGLSRASTTANSAMTSLHGSTFTYIGNTTQATSAATSLTGALATATTGASHTHTAMTSLSSSTTAAATATSSVSSATASASAGLNTTATAASSVSSSMTSAASSTHTAMTSLSSSTTSTTSAVGSLSSAATGASTGLSQTASAASGAASGLSSTSSAASSASSGMSSAASSGGRLSAALDRIKMLGAVALGVLSVAAVGVGHSIVETQREFDKLNAQLITATGSTENAAKAFKELQAFAKTTPYDLAQSVEGFAKLKNLGLDPSIDSLKSFGNTAAAMGKDLNQMIEAVADATTGEFERLKEFGIKSKSEGDKVTFTFQGVSKTVGKNAKEIQQYLLDIGNTQFAGAMDARAKSLDGAISSLGDSWKQLLLTVSQGGVGDAIAGVVRNIGEALDGFTEKLKQPENVQMFKDALDGIGRAFGVIGGVIGAVATGFVAISDAVGSNPEAFIAVGSGLAAIAVALGAISLYAAVPAIIAGISSAMVAFGGALTVALGPVGLIVMAIGALVAAGVYLYRNWDTVKAKATEIWNSVSDSVGNAVQSIADWFSNAGKEIQNEFSVIGNGVKSAMSAISSTVSSVWNGLKSIVSSAMSAVSATVTSAWNGIRNAVSSAINAIKSVVSAGLGLLSSVFRTQFNIIKTVVSTVMNAIKALVQGDMQGVKNAFSSGFAAVVGIVKTAVSNIVSAFGSLGSQLFTIGVQAVQGLANGIKSRISAVGAEARNLASNVANSIRSVLDIRSPSRVTHALGEHAGQGLANGLKAKQSEVAKQAAQLSQQVIDNIASLKRDIALIGKDSNPLAALNYDIENGKYAGVAANLLDNLKTATEAKQIATELYQANQSVTNSIADMNRQIALFGNDNPLSAFLYDMQNTDKYVGATAEKLQMMASKIQQLETLKQTKASEDAFSKLGTDLAQESPMAKLTAEYEQRLAVVDQYEQLHTDKVVEAEAMRKQVKDSYTQASNSLMLTQYEGMFGALAGLTKSFAGEQSGIYRALFATQKAFAVAQAGMNLWKAASSAYADTPGTVWQKLAAASMAVAKGGQFVTMINAIKSPAIGQAHDGIMSVPKSGTWNLEKGERVLPKHTAAAMDKTLANANGGNNVSVNVVVNADGSSDVQANAQMGKQMGDAIKAAVQQEIYKATRQGHILYGR